jgi:uncharacterized protein
MNRFLIEELIKIALEILKGYELDPHGAHGIRHWGRVLENGTALAEMHGGSVRVAQLFALFHDSRRVNEYSDPEHGTRGAELAARMNGSLFQLEAGELALLQEACRTHTGGRGPADITVHACWDADRLDLPRVGTDTRREWLCTPGAREEGFYQLTTDLAAADKDSELSTAVRQALKE